MNLKKWLLGLIPLAALVVTLILISRENRELQQPEELRAAMSSAEGAYFMEGVESKVFDAEGKLSYTLRSPRLDHFPERSASEIRTPIVQINRPKGPPWQMTATQALAQHQTGDMHLQGAVVLQREASADYEPIKMLTDELMLNATAKKAESNSDVKFVSPSGQVTGTGLRADLSTEQLEILANVQGEYVRPTP
ncbi:LPS export ABC transporter periplasmic protein LptC [Permianibacter aggregans]|uniref:Lipopolysaccharide export system protein LptC n=1 Tax=Permianibacter aggregans TaxID=1510150 RepID=A0A4R6UMZ8_9GAMM|nr:LPS export ABC transporter periplasmic protein LptC [Permianibacter aggregans]QGX40671.1 LPS export ABC transporter periplasmic protein LptC [Permianibacter aggregans]TDQ46545.1 LPS export ABC transporter protein LptC [Permianibacter aggregans]